jgi:hypothetical protein
VVPALMVAAAERCYNRRGLGVTLLRGGASRKMRGQLGGAEGRGQGAAAEVDSGEIVVDGADVGERNIGLDVTLATTGQLRHTVIGHCSTATATITLM